MTEKHTAERAKIITLCGSTRFIEEVAVCAWLLERDERAITMGMHLLPQWYGPDLPANHLAEQENVAEQMDGLHLAKIAMSDEIFVLDHGYIGESTRREIAFAEARGIPVRYFSKEPISDTVIELFTRGLAKLMGAGDGC